MSRALEDPLDGAARGGRPPRYATAYSLKLLAVGETESQTVEPFSDGSVKTTPRDYCDFESLATIPNVTLRRGVSGCVSECGAIPRTT